MTQRINKINRKIYISWFYQNRWPILACLIFITILFFSGLIPFWLGLVGFIFLSLTILLANRVDEKYLSPKNKPNAISEINDKKFKLKKNENIFEFTDILIEPTFILDEKTIILYMNKAAKNEFPGAQSASPISFFFRAPKFVTSIEKAIKNNQAQNINFTQSLHNEKYFSCSILPFNFSAAKNKKKHIIILMHDITAQKRAEKMRSDFIANASHELRTPLSSIMGFIETLQGPAAKDEKARKKFLKIMHAQAQRMSKLIDDLLSLSHIELKEHVKPSDDIDLSQIILSVCESLQNQAKEAGLKIELNILPSPTFIKADKNELFELLENIIDNAIKYGVRGEKIEVILQKSKEKDFAYQLNIIDYGIGVSKKDLPRLTERFYRVDADISRQKKGTGLGLAIVKHILNRHEAKLNINSELGIGTNVEILFKK